MKIYDPIKKMPGQSGKSSVASAMMQYSPLRKSALMNRKLSKSNPFARIARNLGRVEAPDIGGGRGLGRILGGKEAPNRGGGGGGGGSVITIHVQPGKPQKPNRRNMKKPGAKPSAKSRRASTTSAAPSTSTTSTTSAAPSTSATSTTSAAPSTSATPATPTSYTPRTSTPPRTAPDIDPAPPLIYQEPARMRALGLVDNFLSRVRGFARGASYIPIQLYSQFKLSGIPVPERLQSALGGRRAIYSLSETARRKKENLDVAAERRKGLEASKSRAQDLRDLELAGFDTSRSNFDRIQTSIENDPGLSNAEKNQQLADLNAVRNARREQQSVVENLATQRAKDFDAYDANVYRPLEVAETDARTNAGKMEVATRALRMTQNRKKQEAIDEYFNNPDIRNKYRRNALLLALGTGAALDEKLAQTGIYGPEGGVVRRLGRKIGDSVFPPITKSNTKKRLEKRNTMCKCGSGMSKSMCKCGSYKKSMHKSSMRKSSMRKSAIYKSDATDRIKDAISGYFENLYNEYAPVVAGAANRAATATGRAAQGAYNTASREAGRAANRLSEATSRLANTASREAGRATRGAYDTAVDTKGRATRGASDLYNQYTPKQVKDMISDVSRMYNEYTPKAKSGVQNTMRQASQYAQQAKGVAQRGAQRAELAARQAFGSGAYYGPQIASLLREEYGKGTGPRSWNALSFNVPTMPNVLTGEKPKSKSKQVNIMLPNEYEFGERLKAFGRKPQTGRYDESNPIERGMQFIRDFGEIVSPSRSGSSGRGYGMGITDEAGYAGTKQTRRAAEYDRKKQRESMTPAEVRAAYNRFAASRDARREDKVYGKDKQTTARYSDAPERKVYDREKGRYVSTRSKDSNSITDFERGMNKRMAKSISSMRSSGVRHMVGGYRMAKRATPTLATRNHRSGKFSI